MEGFDPERYLRRRAELDLADRRLLQPHPGGSSLMSAARALIAVNRITRQSAEAIVADYAAAATLRGQPHINVMTNAPPRAGSTNFGTRERRVVPCFRDVELPAGRLRIIYVTLSDRATRLAVTFISNAGGASPSPGQVSPTGFPGNLTLSDDRGVTTSAGFSGGGSHLGFRGHLRASSPLSKDTRWLEIDGHRVHLRDASTTWSIRIEEVQTRRPALRHLWDECTRIAARHGATLDATIDALVSCGELALDDTDVVAAIAIAAALPHAGRVPVATPATLPEPWRSMTAASQDHDGPIGARVIGAPVPELDGNSAFVSALQSEASGFSLDVELSTHPNLPPFADSLDEPRLVWWAEDDRANTYLGNIGSFSGSSDHVDATIGFWPPLDPQATTLFLEPTGSTARAVIEVPLEWDHR